MAVKKDADRRSGTRAARSVETGIVVTLRSRQGQVVEVVKDSDRRFLELADQFVVDVRRIRAERSRRRRWWRFF